MLALSGTRYETPASQPKSRTGCLKGGADAFGGGNQCLQSVEVGSGFLGAKA